MHEIPMVECIDRRLFECDLFATRRFSQTKKISAFLKNIQNREGINILIS